MCTPTFKLVSNSSALTAKGAPAFKPVSDMWDDPSREGKVEELPLEIDEAEDKEFKDQEVLGQEILDQEFSEDFFNKFCELKTTE